MQYAPSGSLKVFSEVYEIPFPSLSAPASDVSLIYTKPDAQTVNLTCSVEGVYPEPEVELSWGPR